MAVLNAYRAFLVHDFEADPLFATVRLYLTSAKPWGSAVSTLMSDGTWRDVPEGSRMDGAGIALPAESIEAVTEAIERYHGANSHGATETKILREWLAVERGRVDKLLGAALDERQVDPL